MKVIEFRITFRCRDDERLYITGSLSESEGREISETLIPMKRERDGGWRALFSLETNAAKSCRCFSYGYMVRREEGSFFREAGDARKIAIDGEEERLLLLDQWTGRDRRTALLSKPFSELFFSRKGSLSALPPGVLSTTGEKRVLIRLTHPTVKEGMEIAICGNTRLLGEWSPLNAPAMTPMVGQRWLIELPLREIETPSLEYKFVMRPTLPESAGEIIWERGDNHCMTIEPEDDWTTLVKEHAGADLPLFRPKFTGTAVPLFSLRSEKSFGIGEFDDLKLLARWAEKTGQNFIQILPVNDTTLTRTERDSYPYNPISVMALHPIYINIGKIGELREAGLKDKYLKELSRLNSLPEADYTEVLRLKEYFLHKQFEAYGEETMESSGFKEFYSDNKEWIEPYRDYCMKRDRLREDEGDYYLFVQYHLHLQLSEAVAYLHSKKIALKGDIPIGVSPMSVECEKYPSLFNMDQQAGAPPDSFAAEGQNWGFPTYNWRRMAQDGFLWWRKRLEKMSEYFDAYRIDHILGFFRIWEIPRGEANGAAGHFSPALPYTMEELEASGYSGEYLSALFMEDTVRKGTFHPRVASRSDKAFSLLSDKEREAFGRIYNDYFYHRNDSLWRDSALRKLPEIISSTNMLCCGEDLGMIPECVEEVLSEMQILSLEVQRMPKKSGERLGDPSRYPYLSICTTGTHDMSTIRGWWREEHPQESDASVEQCRKIIAEHLDSSSMATILPLQDWLSTDEELRAADPESERINIPSDPDHYWRYRMHITLEELIEKCEKLF